MSPLTRSQAAAGAVLPSPAVSERGGAQPDRSAGPDGDTAAWKRSSWIALAAYLLSRICVIAGAAAVSTVRDVSERIVDPTLPVPPTATGGIFDVLNSWDGQWYYRIIREGYPRSVPAHVTYGMLQARAAFFPLYPLTVRFLDHVLPGGDVFAALMMNFFLGFAAVLMIGAIARHLFDEAIAERSMILLALFPGSFVLSFAYSEALMFVLVGVCLWLLLKERWLLAGLAAALVTACRPNGIAICFACAVAALLAIRQRRQWSALIAPALSPIGWLSFQIFISRHTGENGVWFRVQREAWKEGISFGMTAIRGISQVFVNPLSSPANLLTFVSVVSMVLLLAASFKVRLPAPVMTYSIVVLVLMLIPATVTARPRFLVTAFPLLIGIAAWWPPRWLRVWNWVMVACGAGLVVLTVLYGGFAAIP